MTLPELNKLPVPELKHALLKCCGSGAWVEKISAEFPFDDVEQLIYRAEVNWYACDETDWREAFEHHPKIGDISSLKSRFATTADWAQGEQSSLEQAPDSVIEELALENRKYEEKFGYIFIVCATGKSATEMLSLLKERLVYSPEAEIKNAMIEQSKITRIRLKKLLADEPYNNTYS